MTLKEDMLDDVGIFFNEEEFAEKILYNGISILAIPEIGEENNRNIHDINKTYKNAVFVIKSEDVPEPGVGDNVIYNDVEYTFADILEKQTGIYRLRFINGESAVVPGMGAL